MNRTKTKQMKMKCLKKPLDKKRLENQRPIVRVKALSREESDALIKKARLNYGIWGAWECDDRAEERMDDFNAGE